MSTKIDWCDEVWNPITGCSKISTGCDNCYAERMARRLKGRFGYPLNDPFAVTFHCERLDNPYRWKKPRRIFVNSMGDLFHDDVLFELIDHVMIRIGMFRQHTFIILTKRPQRMAEYFRSRPGSPIPNLWMGVTAEHQGAFNERVEILSQIPAAKRFVSIEPMLGPIIPQLHYADASRHIDWVICGGETGPKGRLINITWVRTLRDYCGYAGVPFFFKSWGTAKSPGDWRIPADRVHPARSIDGKEYLEFPA